MQKLLKLFLRFLLIILLIIIFAFFYLFQKGSQNISLLSPLARNSPQVLSAGLKSEPEYNAPEKPVHILLLGLDGRRGDKNPRCDAIHLLTLEPDHQMLITTIPRGTAVKIPGPTPGNAILGNSCHTVSIEFAVSQIAKITGTQPDYIVKVGFSQALGIFRILNLPSIDTLQFLRNRNFAIGDYQRSHNQAVFIKDMISKYLPTVNSFPPPFKFLLYRLVETNLEFDQAERLLERLAKSQFDKNPGQIILVTKPSPPIRLADIHFPDTNKQPGNSNLKDEEYLKFQNEIKSYLINRLKQAEKLITNNKLFEASQLLQTPFTQKLWLQVEDEKTRDDLHYNFLRLIVFSTSDKTSLRPQILDYITEMEATERGEYKKMAEKLLETIKE
ncbi:hypothetical protein A2960_06070 [Candidatus Gottesmanbacteria bacterium RIFCSPLOWO2_01_FULL_39_12b]|uniref:Cell envelope-related transcriptional attenuator domain-containing protein n=1 Tax=Candidatus Gottesmanbacteria bacterium RIFCSPLOWO2_01_FULL_39_12b TaxID=1798388 RepID=A0A1F6AP02_9BACT|nr:MAG: hypothetical protein A2960_06070 [Candidatus Gottesmanbacteria bacterium RIFCSPLOWO2_01_FULL_39_12b]